MVILVAYMEGDQRSEFPGQPPAERAAAARKGPDPSFNFPNNTRRGANK